jgi:hypothetical protein
VTLIEALARLSLRSSKRGPYAAPRAKAFTTTPAHFGSSTE